MLSKIGLGNNKHTGGNMIEHLFVYGTLRKAAQHPMHSVLAQYARWVGQANYQADLFLVAHYPGAVPCAHATHPVVGEVYQILEPATLLPLLDAYEECGPTAIAPAEYRREWQEVTLIDGEKVACWVYIYNKSTAGLTQITSGDFLRF